MSLEIEKEDIKQQFETVIATDDKLQITDFLNDQNISDVAGLINDYPEYEAHIIGNMAIHRAASVFKILDISQQKDIVKELEKPGLDPRKSAKVFEFDPNVKSIKDLRTGMILPGIVNNITAFGCFVDVGVKESGLVHISQLKEGFVSDVNEVVKLHQHVQVKVVEVDEDRKRIQLTMVL